LIGDRGAADGRAGRGGAGAARRRLRRTRPAILVAMSSGASKDGRRLGASPCASARGFGAHHLRLLRPLVFTLDMALARKPGAGAGSPNPRLGSAASA
jgi:hypothetical protein